MDNLKLCCLAPHPPIVVPEVGGREAQTVKKTADALWGLGLDLRMLEPVTLVVMSPHTPIYREGFSVLVGSSLSGSLAQFRAPEVRVDAQPDEELADAIVEAGRETGVHIAERSTWGGEVDLDHGVLVPLYFLAPKDYRLVCVSISMFSYEDHYKLGTCIRTAADMLGRRTVFIASGDMSHRLLPGAPAGFSPRGEEFDRDIVRIISSGEFSGLFDLDPSLVDDAGECGLRSIFTMAGAMDGYSVKSEVLSYEGPFGVGYLVARVEPLEPDEKRVRGSS